MSARKEIEGTRFTRKSIGRNAFRDLRRRGLVNKEGYVTKKGVKFFSSLFDTIDSLPELDKEDEAWLDAPLTEEELAAFNAAETSENLKEF